MLDNTWLIAGLSICIGAGLLYRHQKSQQKELEQTIETLNEKEQFIHAQRQEMNQQMILQASIEERLQYTEQQLVTAKESLASKDAETLGLQQQHNQAQIDITTLETQLRAERQSTEEKLSLLDHAKHQMSDQF